MMMLFKNICLAAWVFAAVSNASAATLERNIHSGWKFKQERLINWYPASVPGVVHTDLLANKIIEDPFLRLNERGLQWIDKEDWVYETTFDVSEAELAQSNIALRFKGLDVYADVFLNEEKILVANNMFREWVVDVKAKLKPQGNQLRVYFHSPIKIDIPKFDALPYRYRTGPDQAENGGIFDKRVSIFARKAGYHYGWDWGPRFVTMGIWRPVILQAWSGARIADVYVQQKEVTAKQALITTHVEVLSDSDMPNAKVVVKDDATGKLYGEKVATLKKGSNKVAIDFTVKNPKLWWCNGLGEAHLYTFQTNVMVGEKQLDTKLSTTGLRSLKAIYKPDKDGIAFYLELNGKPVFSKGANYIPQDNFLPRVTPEKYEKTIMDAVNTNMNTLRVWGGGIYEEDIFYELCDKHGIMVWQDFMFACSLYPSEGEFLENIRQEAIDNVKRLRNHPSIALWCGNNEVYYFWTIWGFDEDYRKQNPEYEKIIWKQYTDLFDGVLPSVVNEYSAGTYYLPSSPYNEKEDEVHNGDRHYWGVWHGKEPTTNFNTVRSRFFSEYGFQSFPEFESVKIFAPQPEDWSITSEVMMHHQRAGSYANPRIAEYLQNEYKEPKKFEDFLYMSQVIQGDAIKIAIEAHRRDMPYCWGTLFWQHNDCWPVASWASRDYYGRWKAQHYFARDAYKDILVSPIADEKMFNIFIVSDRLKATEGELKLKVTKLDGTTVSEQSAKLKVPANTSTKLLSLEVEKLLNGVDKKDVFVTTVFTDKGGKAYSNRYFLASQKDIDFPTVSITKEVKAAPEGVEVTLQSDKFARAVFLSIDGINNFFENNYFDLFPGQKYTVKVKTSLSEQEFAKQLKVVSLRDAY